MKLSLAILSLLSGATNAQYAPFCESTHPYSYDSGSTSPPTGTIVSHPGAPWIQLNLSGTDLAPDARLVLLGDDGARQELDAGALGPGGSSNGYSAVFDGDSVTVELVGGDLFSTGTSRVRVSGVNVGLCDDLDLPESICGDVDDRAPSTDVRVGRIGGCTGWLISEDTFIRAGHCGDPKGSTRMHFTFGRSSAPPEDQYAVDVPSYVKGTGFGNDWAVGRLLPNSETGELPGVAQSEACGAPGCGWYTIGAVPTSTSGNSIRITGYGIADVDSRSQKTHVDALTEVETDFLRYIPDTTRGNSGSPVIHEETGHAVGVHTHGGCDNSLASGNKGTRIDKANFRAAIDSLCVGRGCRFGDSLCQGFLSPVDLIWSDDICVDTADVCEAEADLDLNGRESCKAWCQREGLVCTGAWNDAYRDACKKKNRITCSTTGKQSSICRCEPRDTNLCNRFLSPTDRIVRDEICTNTPSRCTALADLDLNDQESCDQWCQREGLKCTKAWNEVYEGDFCEKKNEILCSTTGKKRSICQCDP